MRIRDVMTESVVTAQPDASVQEVANLMRERNVGSVVIGRGEEPEAFVTDRDLTISVLADGRGGSDRAVDHASSPVITGRADMEVEEAAELMVRHGVRRLVVVDDDRLTGIVTLDDLVARIGDLDVVASITAQVTRAALPNFYFHERGG